MIVQPRLVPQVRKAESYINRVAFEQPHAQYRNRNSPATNPKMRLPVLFLGLCAQIFTTSAVSDFIDSTTVYIQPVDTSSPASPLAEIKYNPSTLDAELVSFEAPEFADDTKLVRIGVYDTATSTWKSSTSMTSSDTFSRGFRPTLVLSLDAQGGVLGVTCKSGKIDAGQTRDFAPKVTVRKMAKAKQPELNRPVVLSKEGKLEEPEPEKTFLQK